ncbi:MAG: hypothetical protein JSU63_18530 [Phycisphaerales bacterium]|nr:MAG: hypothetical protein JSU63_18530 [Phycisphaerales bacterium]
MTWRRTRVLAIVVAMAGMPFVTSATCDPLSGTFDFYRDDDRCDGLLGDLFCEDWYYDDCWFCF